MSEDKMLKPVQKNDALRYELAVFLSDPNRDKTQGEWAKEKGITEQTISRWKKEPIFKETLINRLEDYLLDDSADIYKVIKDRAKKGDYQFVTLYLKQVDLLKAERKEQGLYIDLSPLREMANIVKKEIEDAKKDTINAEIVPDEGSVPQKIS